MNSDTPIESALNGVGTVETPALAPEEKKSKGAAIGMVALGLLAAAGIGFGIYEFMDSSKKADEIKDLKGQISQQTPSNPTDGEGYTLTDVEIAGVMDKEVYEVVTTLKQALDETAGTSSHSIATNLTTIVKLDGTDFKTGLDKAYGVRYDRLLDRPDTFELATALKDKAVAKLVEMGFTATQSTTGTFATYLNYVNSDNVICQMDDGGSAPFEFTCAYLKWKSVDSADFTKQLAEAYKNKEGSYPIYVNAKVADIKDSSVSPYQTLVASGENYAMLYYRTSADADWQYFTGTQELVPCSEYNTQDLKNAYAGQQCGAEDFTVSTVQP